jgi:hypothetical protein
VPFGVHSQRRTAGPILLVLGSLFFYVFVQPSAEVAPRD